MMRLIKKTLLFTIPLVFSACIFDSDDDVEPWNAEKVCPTEGTNAYGMPNRGTFTDERDGQVYRYTTIGDQVWMAENLRYDAPYSMCSNDSEYLKQYCELIEHNCETESCCRESMCNLFGRYYSIIESGKAIGIIDTTLADTICPKGWHIPTKKEWENLETLLKVSGENDATVAYRMKSTDSTFFAISKNWPNEYDKMVEGTDDCALGGIPSGYLFNDGLPHKTSASFLSSTQEGNEFIETFRIANKTDFTRNVSRNTIRCVMDSVDPEL